MQRRRRVNDFLKLTSGPGNLTKAMAMNSRHNGADLVRDRNLFIYVSKKRESFEIVRTRREGIAKDKNRLLRFYIKGNDFVSGPK